MIVLRAPDLVFEFDGWWFDSPESVRFSGSAGLAHGVEYELVRTDRFERRDSDGATARVYEVRPL